MRNVNPNALSLAVAIAIGSSVIATQVLAERRLQIRPVDVGDNEQVEFIHSEVTVQPTLDDDQQPIPNSFTTTYKAQDVLTCASPSMGFTDILYSIDSDVTSVDLFETGENNVARKYTKVVKVGDKSVFRFTHDLAEKQLVIEVRDGMTHRDLVKAIRAQWSVILSLEPLTKIARPDQLFGLLETVDKRAGNLGTTGDYVALATIEVDKVEVNDRTFMRLISGGDQPPELTHLGKSLFVNDEALLAAATSAYIQVHVLGEELQQQALNDLLAHSKPVGYVVHAEDDTYLVPAGYPKLAVAQAPGEVIVFHGQMQNPHDIAFVETLHSLWQEAEGINPTPTVVAQVKKYGSSGISVGKTSQPVRIKLQSNL
ncbi:hypothetical protein [Endozoicomonas sp. 4G]|uniref:hypothetical protein n=1 Tax=Endozoicomonas sp. 4G TaxID=2872754 RepID=UPI0020790FB8|nr:hypothetical protein [Endozoicomonas sp. 4G]